jgi:hypothetical protein
VEKPKRRWWSLEVEDQPASTEPGQRRTELVSIGVRFLKGFIFAVVLMVLLAFLAQGAISGH